MSGITTLSAIASRSTAVLIADQLRERIIDGSFGPGAQINEAQVAQQLDVSRGPVREALQRLVQEGLLIGRPNRGVFVREFTQRDIAEVYEAREVIECAATEAILAQDDQAARDDLFDRMHAIVQRMQTPLDARDWNALSRVDLEFHTVLVEAGGNSRLVRAYQTLATEALICLSHFENTYLVSERVLSGHLEIAELMRRGDMDPIHRALHQHLSIDNFELHRHPVAESLRHGRTETGSAAQ